MVSYDLLPISKAKRIGAVLLSIGATILVLSLIAPIQGLVVSAQSSNFSLTINTQDTTGRTITGLWTVLSQNGQTMATGFSPVRFNLASGQPYVVTVSNYGQIFFDHWADNSSTNPVKPVS